MHYTFNLFNLYIKAFAELHKTHLVSLSKVVTTLHSGQDDPTASLTWLRPALWRGGTVSQAAARESKAPSSKGQQRHAACPAGHRTSLISKELLFYRHRNFVMDTSTLGCLFEGVQTVPYSKYCLSEFWERPAMGPIEDRIVPTSDTSHWSLTRLG